jgi:hypothetical protein
VAIIEENRYRLTEPSRGEDKVNNMVSVNVACLNLETPGRCDEPNRLPSGCRKLQLNPVFSAGEATLAGLNTGNIRNRIAVEIRDRERQPRPSGCRSGIVNLFARSSASQESEQEQKTQRSKGKPHGHAAVVQAPLEFKFAVEVIHNRASFHSAILSYDITPSLQEKTGKLFTLAQSVDK